MQISALPGYFLNIGNFIIVHLSKMFSLKRQFKLYIVM